MGIQNQQKVWEHFLKSFKKKKKDHAYQQGSVIEIAMKEKSTIIILRFQKYVFILIKFMFLNYKTANIL